MYHLRFKNSHYAAGFHWGQKLLRNHQYLPNEIIIQQYEERDTFAKQCLPIYKKYYPEILQEIKGIMDAQQDQQQLIQTFLLSMYCFALSNYCSCFAIQNNQVTLLARNSDFLVSLEKTNKNCLYQLDNAYAFQANTTAFVQMEDGMNEHGFAIGLTFVYPKIIKPGLNAGMLVRFLLEKCKSTQEAIAALKTIPIASQQTLTMIDANGDMAVVECNANHVEVILPKADANFVASTNDFISNAMHAYKKPSEIDDWRSQERYEVITNALNKTCNDCDLSFAQSILAGEHGFLCQYDRKQNADTVWSVIYDTKAKKIHRVEGNPSRKPFKEDKRTFTQNNNKY